MCAKCGCGKKMGEKGYGKGPSKTMASKSSAMKKMPVKKMSRGK